MRVREYEKHVSGMLPWRRRKHNFAAANGRIYGRGLVARGEISALIGRGGGGICRYPCSARLISFKMNLKNN